MSLSLKQYQAVYNKHLLAILKEGKIPSFEEVVARAGKELPSMDAPISPVYKYIPQAEKTVFDIDLYNRSVNAILSDIKILFDELTEIEFNNIRRIIYADLFNKTHSYELSRLDKQLNALLFSLQGADDNFFGVFDNFKDTSKIDFLNSTPGILSTSEGCLALPVSAKGTFKIPLDHLFDITSFSYNFSRSNIVNKGNIPGSIAGNLFKDSNEVWGLIVESETNEPLEVTFSFRLKQEEYVNKITVVPYSPKPEKIFVLTSIDGQNIKSFTDYSDGINLVSQANVYSLDFPDTLVDYIFITLRKEEPDFASLSDEKNIYTYNFGLKNISVLTTGRETVATYYSKPFTFSNNLGSIGKVAISTTEKIPQKTRINWFVAGSTEAGDLIGDYISITPQSRTDNSGPSKVVSFQDIAKNSSYIISTSTSYSNIFTSNSIDFYSIGSITTEPIFGTAQLYRGFRSWYRDTLGVYDTISVSDSFVPFSKAPSQYLYATYQEAVTLRSVGPVDTQRVALTRYKPLYVNNGSFSLIPNKDIDSSKDSSPYYAIYKVELTSGVQDKTKSNATFTSSIEDLGQPNIVYNSATDIVIQDVSGNTVIKQFADGTDYIVELTSDGYPTGRIILTANSALLNAATGSYRIQYKIDPNITRFVTSIKNNQVYFTIDSTNAALSDEQAIIKYRFVPSNIIKSSLKAKGLFGLEGNKKIYTQGIDYIFDSSNGLVQWLSTGSIPNRSDLFFDFKYKDNISSIQQFFIWAYIPESSSVEISLKPKGVGTLSAQNELVADTSAGESFMVNIPALGLVDLTQATKLPKMTGWVQFIVKSKSPDLLLGTSQVPLINQVILLKDINSNYIFVSGGKYFASLTAIREPLIQVSLPYLKSNVLKNDRTKFAINSAILGSSTVYQIVTNFQPGSTNELYSYSVDVNTGSLVKNSEEWKLLWISKQSSDQLTHVVVKAILTRAPDTDGNITPKVFNYYLKGGF